MKQLISLLLIAVLGLLPACANPLPAAPIHLSWDLSPDAAVTFQTVYEKKPTDADWVLLRTVDATTKDIVLSNPPYGTLYTLTAGDSAGHESPMSNVVTNYNLATPGGLKVGRL